MQKVDGVPVETTAKERAKALLGDIDAAFARKADRVAELIAQRAGINEELAELGVKRVREKKAKIGRPKGSRNRPAAATDAERNAGVDSALQGAVNAAAGEGL